MSATPDSAGPPRGFVAPDVSPAARPWVTGGLALGAIVSAGWILLVAGEILSDPGGWTGAAWTAAWLVPSLALAVVAIAWPRVAYPILVIATGVVIAAAFGAMFRADALWQFEDTHGPVSLLVEIGLLIPLTALGRSMPTRAGWLLALAIAAPLGLQAIRLLIVGQWSVILVLVIVAAPYALVALLYVVGGRANATRAARPIR